MVAARAANPASDVSIASELGSLVIAHVQIGHPRWRLDAIVRSVPALRRFGVGLDHARARIRDGVTAAICPTPLRHQLVQLLDDSLDHASAEGLARIVSALWRPDWIGAAMHAVKAALAIDAADAARRFAASPGRYLRPRLEELMRRGYAKPDVEVVADLSRPGSEQAFAPSLPLAIALVDEIAAHGQQARATCVDAQVAALRGKQRSIVVAHAARLDLRFRGVAAAVLRARSIRERDVRDGAFALLVREALAIDELDAARELATQVRGHRLSQWLVVERARALFDRDRHVDALRLLAGVTERSVASARRLLESEIRLAVRQTREDAVGGRDTLRHAWQPAPWIAGPSAIDVATRFELVLATVLLRFGSRRTSNQVCVDDAARILSHLPGRQVQRVEWLHVARRSGIDIDDGLTALRCAESRLCVDAYVAEHIAMRAAELERTPGSLPSLMARGLAGHTDCAVSDPTAIERALFDEGLALSAAAPGRRRVLLGVVQHCLRSALVEPQRWTAEVIASRLRMLVHLGGELARATIEKAVRTLPARAETTAFAIECACKLDARRAGELVFARLIEMRAAGVDIERVVRRVEHHGGVERGFARAFALARAAIDAQLASTPADRWLLDFMRRWRDRTGTLPSARALMFIAEQRTIATDAGEMFALLASVDDELRGDSHVAVALRVATDHELLERLLVADPPRIDDSMKIWMTWSWRTLLDTAVAPSTTIDPAIVLRGARLLGCTNVDALRRGELTALGVAARSEVDVRGERYRLRLLDKRTDLMTYLRFADLPARSCYRSDSWFYVGGTQSHVLAVWHDPLSFCFHVEREVDARFRPCGFLFGGFAEVDGQPAVALNSLHMRPKRADVRERLLRAFEQALCVPLGITRIGIASCHGGRGPLPSDYVARPVSLTRLRALSAGGKPVTDAWDDISYEVNARTEVTHLLWKSCSNTR